MPKEGEKHEGVDVGGGLKSVPGVTKNGKPIENYKPIWTARMESRFVPTVPEKTFKFFRSRGDDPVR
jgi:hypothetical protein